MPSTLNEDTYRLVFDRINDLQTLKCIAEATSRSSKHPMRSALIRRILQFPISLSSDELVGGKELIESIVSKSTTHSIHLSSTTINLRLGPAKSDYLDSPKIRERRAKALRLFKTLPAFFAVATNLTHIKWSGVPLLTGQIANVLLNLPRFESLALNGAPGVWWSNWDNENPKDLKEFFAGICEKLKALELVNVSQDAFTEIYDSISPLQNLSSLHLDLSYGHWEWDGVIDVEDDQAFSFSKTFKNLQKFWLAVCDTAVTSHEYDPLALVETQKLEEFVLWVSRRFDIPSSADVIIFDTVTSQQDFSSLLHLEIHDEILDPRQNLDDQEFGRYYRNLPQFLLNLPRLRRLWCNERCLCAPPHEVVDDDLRYFQFDERTDVNMHKTISDSARWGALKTTFSRLDSLRVGFGPMDANWATTVLRICNPNILGQFGFDWEWQPHEPISSQLLDALAGFPLLTDLHILYERRPEEQDDDVTTRCDLQQIFKACPHIVRIGIGRNKVWERATPERSRSERGPDVCLVSEWEVPRFFNAGPLDKELRFRWDSQSQNDPNGIGKGDGGVLRLLDELIV